MSTPTSEISEVISYSSNTHCAGGKTFLECDAALSIAKELGLDQRITSDCDSNDVKPNYLYTHAYLPLGCVACGSMCELSEVSAEGVAGFHVQVRSMSPDFFAKTRWPILEKLTREALQSIQEKDGSLIPLPMVKNTTMDPENSDTIDSR